jgi:hypothetical protein
MFQRPYSALVFVVCLWLAIPLAAQRLVSTSPQARRAVLEEFGGMYCVYCPHGHQIIADLQQTHGDNLISLNYHVGAYASPIGQDPDLRTDYGAAIAERTGLSGYPVGTVNRQVFAGSEQGVPGTTALNRTHWVNAVEEVLGQDAPVNIALEANLNITTRELDVYVEYYYTAGGPGLNNRLHLAVLQHNVLAPQHGGGEGGFYAHQSLVRDFLTGADGHLITTNSSGTFGSLNFQVQLPASYRDVWVDPVNIELVAFISENEQNILNGVSLAPTLEANEAADANLLALKGPDDICGGYYQASVLLRNDGQTLLRDLVINYGLSGVSTDQYYWSGQLATFETTLVRLPAIAIPERVRNNEAFAQLEAPNAGSDPTLYNNDRTHAFTVAPRTSAQALELMLRTDEYGYELYWEVVDEFGEVYASGGNQVVGETSGGAQIATAEDTGAYPSNSLVIEDIYLPEEGCYQLRVLDDFADGMCCHYGNGFYRLREAGQPSLLQGAEFGAVESQYFYVGGALVSTEAVGAPQEMLSLSPNPLRSGQQLQLHHPAGENPAPYQWQLYSAAGQLLSQGAAPSLPPTTELTPGYYILQLLFPESRQNLPFVVQ